MSAGPRHCLGARAPRPDRALEMERMELAALAHEAYTLVTQLRGARKRNIIVLAT